MDDASFEFLGKLLASPTVSGFEQVGAKVVRQWLSPLVDETRTDVHGNTFFVLNPGGSPKVMLAGHIDQIGFLVKHISEQGFLYLVPVGGVDLAVVPGSRLTVHTAKGPVQAVVGRKAIHLMKTEERDGAKKFELADLPIDIGAKDREAAAARVQIGDPVTFTLGVLQLGDDLITAHALDDRIGVWVVAEAFANHRQRPHQARPAESGGIWGRHGAGGDRLARGTDGRLWHRAAGWNRSRCMPFDRYARR